MGQILRDISNNVKTNNDVVSYWDNAIKISRTLLCTRQYFEKLAVENVLGGM